MTGRSGDTPGAVFSLVPTRLKKRPDFLRVARGQRSHHDGFILQARERSPADTGAPRIGFTTSRKVGNAVARNRARRRLRAICRAVDATLFRAGWDYVLIGRAGRTAEKPFDDLCRDLELALKRLSAG